MPDLRAAVVSALDVEKAHPARGGLLGRARAGTRALRGVSIRVLEGEIYGLVGRSGAGKSTLARVLALLEKPDRGEVRYGDLRVDHLPPGSMRPVRRLVQIVFQDPGSSIDPLQSVRGAVEEPLVIHRLHGRRRRERVTELLADVGLPTSREFLERYPRELSGGERQRLAIARALACEPQALILDEPVSALDVSIRGQVLDVLGDLRARQGLAQLFIAHDLALVADVCDRVGVMLAGRIVEEGPAVEVMSAPLHPHTRTLVDAATGGGDETGEPDERHVHEGGGGECPLRRYCRRANAACGNDPELVAHRSNHAVACHFPGES